MDFIPVITHLSTLLDSSRLALFSSPSYTCSKLVQLFDPSIHQVNVDGVSLSLQALVSVARHNTRITIDESTRTKVQSSQKVLQEKLEANVSIYGVSTGFGGSGKRSFFSRLGHYTEVSQRAHEPRIIRVSVLLCSRCNTAVSYLLFMITTLRPRPCRNPGSALLSLSELTPLFVDILA